jgi:hypothetical protein
MFSALSLSSKVHEMLKFVAWTHDDRWYCGAIIPEHEDQMVTDTSYSHKEVATHANLAEALDWLTEGCR